MEGDGGGDGGGGGGLSEEELALLLQDDHVKRAVEEIAADPEAVARYADDAVVMGVLQALG